MATRQRLITEADLAANPLLVTLGAEAGWVCSPSDEAGTLTEEDVAANPIILELGGRIGGSLLVRAWN